MKKKVIAIFSCGILMVAAAGCRTSQTETTGTMNEVAVREESVDEATYAGNSDDDIICDVNNLSEAQQRMSGPMGALIYCYDSDSATGHKWVDAGWGTLSTLVNDFSTIEDAGTRAYGDANNRRLILGSFLKECASAMYADFDGELPPTPSPDQIVAWGIQNQQGDYYEFGYGDRGMDTHFFYITSWIEHADGTCTVEMQEWTWEPSSLIAIYDIELVKNEYTAAQTNPYFIYSVASINKNDEKTKEWLAEQTATNNDYILPDSDTRYYTESELSGLSKDDLRLARNEIYARHGRKFDSEYLQEYFGGQAWYHGTIEPSDFSEDMLNDYEKANIQVIESLENSTGQNVTSSTDSSEFSFASLEGKDFCYGSGHGAWGTTLTIYADGAFSGVFSDWNGGDTDETHPNGEYDYCEFTGKFSEPKKIDDYTYSATVEYMDQVYESGTSEIKDGCLYNYTDPYGINVGDEFMIYLPGTLIEELPESYVNQKYITDTLPESLSSYGLFNATEAAVFG